MTSFYVMCGPLLAPVICDNLYSRKFMGYLLFDQKTEQKQKLKLYVALKVISTNRNVKVRIICCYSKQPIQSRPTTILTYGIRFVYWFFAMSFFFSFSRECRLIAIFSKILPLLKKKIQFFREIM